MRLAIIPARGGSKRIPNKNIVSFCGKPMISYALKSASQSGLFDCIHVSTDSNDISSVVIELGYEVEFMRDKSLADDYTGLMPVMRWVHEQYMERGKVFDEICCIMPNAPLLESDDLNIAFKTFHHYNKSYPLLVFAKFPVPIEWAFSADKSGLMHAQHPKKLTIRSQDLGHAYYECGPFTIWSQEQLRNEDPLANGVVSYVMPRERAIDIDTLEDLLYAEKLFMLSRE